MTVAWNKLNFPDMTESLLLVGVLDLFYRGMLFNYVCSQILLK
jgi:hypothetical protein